MPPTEPAGWWKRLDERVAQTSEARSRRSIGVNYSHELFPLVLEAARQRDISMTAYQRRASLAFAEFDLGFDWLDEMRSEPSITTYAGSKPVLYGGIGFGPWKIVDLSDHAPDLPDE